MLVDGVVVSGGVDDWSSIAYPSILRVCLTRYSDQYTREANGCGICRNYFHIECSAWIHSMAKYYTYMVLALHPIETVSTL